MNLGLPELPDLHNVSLLLDGTTDQYVWYRSPAYWRADDVTGTGESDTYADGGVTYLWNYGTNLLTQITGAQPVRLPRAADLLPPALARRLLDTRGPRGPDLTAAATAGSPGWTRRACGWSPPGPGTTVGSVRDLGRPGQRAPGPGPDHRPRHGRAAGSGRAAQHVPGAEPGPSRTCNAVIPHPAPSVGLTTTRLPDVDGVLNGDGDGDNDGDPFPPQLGGLRHVALAGQPAGGGDLRQRAFPLRAAAAAQAGWARTRSTPRSRPGRTASRCPGPRGPGGNPGRRADPDAAAVRSDGQGRVPPRGLPVHRRGDPGRAGAARPAPWSPTCRTLGSGSIDDRHARR